MGAAVALGNVVGEAQDVFVIAVIPLQRDIDPDAFFLRGNGNRFGHQRLLVPVKIFHESSNPAFVKQIMLEHFLMPLVAQQDAHARVQESELAIAMLQLVKIVVGDVFERIV